MTPAEFFQSCELTGNKSIGVFVGDEKIVGWTLPKQFDRKTVEISNLLKNKPGEYLLQAKPSNTSKTVVLSEAINEQNCKMVEAQPIKNKTVDLDIYKDFARAEAENQYLKTQVEELRQALNDRDQLIEQLENDLNILSDEETDPQGVGALFQNQQIIDSTAQLLQAFTLKLLNFNQNGNTQNNSDENTTGQPDSGE